MQLKRVKIQNYKCLRDVEVDFLPPAGEEENFSARFLVGVNGSGKSCFLEALGLIFTRLMQGEVPGFPFELEYEVEQEQAHVRVLYKDSPSSEGEKLNITVTSPKRGKEKPRSLSDKYLPRRIVSCSSGANHMMESVLLSSRWEALASDLYDLAQQSGSEEEIALRLEQYRELDTNPRVFSLDGQTARLILPALFAVVPNFTDPALAEDHFQLRDQLLSRIGGGLRPAAFSITIEERLLEEAIREKRNSPQYSLLAKLFRTKQPDGSGPLHSWMVRRPLSPQGTSLTAVFRYEPWQRKEDWLWSPSLSQEFSGDPMLLLNLLLAAQQRGILLDVQLAFHTGSRSSLLGMETLSDGELMWLARMGLVLMSRLARSGETLFLFDEPDAHFNSEWNMDYIGILRQFAGIAGKSLAHEFVIATHSTLLLTDAYPEQITLFTAGKDGIQVDYTPVSPFAAQQDEVARQLFSASAVGSYAARRVNSLMERAQTPEEILELIRQTGPGYQRFRLYERYHELLERKK